MTLGGKLAKLRRENNFTQEQLAELLGVSRQAISKWESNAAYPETEKLIRLGRLYGCSMDYLLLDEKPRELEPAQIKKEESGQPKVVVAKLDPRAIYIERTSKKKIGNLPLWHINIGYGRVARGIFAVGRVSVGVVSVGLCSVGVISFGVVGVGILGIGAFAAGLAAIGAISVGVLSLGAVSLGIFALGASAIGYFSVGAAAIGKYAACGEAARAAIAIGHTDADGTLFETVNKLTDVDIETVRSLLDKTVPWYLSLFKKLFSLFVK